MGRRHIKLTGFYPTIMQKTSCERLETNFLLNTVDTKSKTINYVIPNQLMAAYTEKIIDYIVITGEITHDETIELLFDDIFPVYKKKVATVRIPLLILNMLVINGILYSDNNEDYKLVKSQVEVREWFDDFFMNVDNK